MKKIFSSYPTVARFTLAVILFAASLVLADIIEKIIHIRYTGFLLLVGATWILYRTENKTLKEIGLNINLKNVSFLFLGLILGIVSFAVSSYFRTVYTGEKWHINPNIDWLRLAKGLYIVLPTAATQQLIFRGYPYKKTIETSNLLITNSIWGLLFVVYHDIWGNLIMVPFMVISLLLAHYVFASSLLKSATLYFPIGIHWGNNWSTQHFNGYNITDKGIFYITNQQNFDSWQAFVILWLSWNIGFLILGFLFWKWKKTTFKPNSEKIESTATVYVDTE